jgi:phosphonate transport system ATP-binding protein
LILADEPVASLDPVTSHMVMRDLQRINRELGITTLINLHFLDLARAYGKRLIGLRDGELVFDGDIANVDEDVFRGIYGRAITPEDLLETAGP